MRAHLLHREGAGQPFGRHHENADALIEDLGLESLLDAMARGDALVASVARRTLLTSLGDVHAIRYRQDVLRDALAQPNLVRGLYRQATDAVTSDRRRTYVGFGVSAATTLSGAVHIMEFLLDALRQLRATTDRRPADLRSEGLRALFDMVTRDLDDAYLNQLRTHVQQLRLRGGIHVQARLGRGLNVADPVLAAPSRRRRWLQLLPPPLTGEAYKITPPEDGSSTFLDDLRHRSLQEVATTLATATDHVTGFFDDLRAQLAFYVGCLNLHEALAEHGQPVCVPELAPAGTSALDARGLYDAGLCLRAGGPVVGNDVRAGRRTLVVITGANQGGKSTFLRSVGISQLMSQSGMFAPAESLSVRLHGQLFTHFKSGEDLSLRRGQLDAELARISAIVDRLRPGDMVLLNESFSSTNDHEGSQIAAGILRALVESGITVLFVTHLLEVGDAVLATHGEDALFLRAERRPDGRRTYRLVEGAPLSTSYARDLYDAIFPAGRPRPA